jgi:hypothetical protein
MIEQSQMVLFGRHEAVTDDTRALSILAEPFLATAERAWYVRWPDRLDAWAAWDVMALFGPVGGWQVVDFLEYEGFGRTHAPTLMDRWRYLPLLGIVDPVPIERDPPVLHQTWRLLPSDGHPDAPHAYRQSYVERLRTLDDKLERRGLFDPPQAFTRRGWDALLQSRGIEIIEDDHGRFKLEENRYVEGP